MVLLSLLALGLFVWLIVVNERVTRLAGEVDSLRRQIAPNPSLSEAAWSDPAPPTPFAREAAAAPPASPPPIEVRTAATAIPQATTATPATRLITTQAPVARQPIRPGLDTWLSENGLAWIGGSALVIGGGLLVGYAVQRGVFTPPWRIAAAVALGFLLLGAGEAIRRGRLAGFGGHKLAASISSGAGASMLYAATWASSGLYGFISAPVCAALLSAIAAGLVGLAVVNGEALAILALGGAFATPLVTGADAWSVTALTLYLAILVAAGLSIAWVRGWSRAAWTVLAGSMVWCALAAAQADALKCALLGLEPLAAFAALAYFRPRPLGHVGSGVVVLAGLAALLAGSLAYGGRDTVAIALLVGVAGPLLTAAVRRRGDAAVIALAAPAAGLVLAAAVARTEGHDTFLLAGLWSAQAATLSAAALWAAWRDNEAEKVGAVGALGTLALGLVAGAGANAQALAPIGPAVAMIVLALGAAWLARTKGVERQTLEVWGGTSSAALLATLALAMTWRWAPFGFAAATIGLALLGRRLGWRSVMGAAVAASGLGLVGLLLPHMLSYGLASRAGAIWVLASGLVLGAASLAAARIVDEEPGPAEALRSIAPIAALSASFVFLRWLSAANVGVPLDGLTEAALRTVLIASAGLASLVRLDTEPSRFARWRGHALMAAAVLHGLVFQGLLFNPRWSGDPVGGIVVINALAVAYLAPAIMFGVASGRVYPTNRPAGRAYAVAALVTGIAWAFLEIRRLFTGPQLGGDLLSVGAGEAVATSLVLLGLAALFDRARRYVIRDGAHPFWGDAVASLSVARFAATAYALIVAGW